MKQKLLDLRGLLTTLMLFVMLGAAAQSTTVKGTVIDKTGEPLVGVTVLEKGNTANGVATDLDGQFAITVKSPKATLLFSSVGMENQEVGLNGRTDLTVTMLENAEMLDEVVVVGYGTMKKSDLAGASSSLGEDAMKGSVITNLDQSLAGRATGVTAVQTSGAPGSASSIRVRGQATINANAEPLYVIDGVIVQGGGSSGSDFGLGDALGNGKVSTVSPLSTINPSDIVSMEILKDASATAIYGAQGSNGVILITTKRGQAGKAKFTYEGMAAWAHQNKRLDVLNLREYAELYNLGARTPGAERAVEPVAQLLQFGGPPRRHRRLHLVGQVDGRGAGAFGERKDVEERRLEPGQQVVGGAEVGFRLAGEAHDDVDADERVGHPPPHGRDAVGEAGCGVTAAHEPQNPVGTALQGDVEVVLELGRGGAEVDDLVGQQVGLDRRNAVAVDPPDLVQRPQQVDELLARGAAEIAGVDPCDDDLALAVVGDLPRFLDQLGDRHVAARAAGVVDRTIGTAVVAAVLHLQKGARAVAARKGGEERHDRIGVAAVDPGPALAGEFDHPFI